jgi:cob(I)alamin adenosyltransferase
MKVYTKTGDKGTTALVGGKRVAKASVILEAYGTVDELNSWMGMTRDQANLDGISEQVIQIQNTLFNIGALLASEPKARVKYQLVDITTNDVAFLGQKIDEMETELPPITQFILPGGNTAISSAHIARTTCRRAERRILEIPAEHEVPEFVVPYINRLSDYLFVLARYITLKTNAQEIPWTSK